MPRVSASEREATRVRLIEAGKTEFAARGLAGARFDEISLAAGHAKGTIYNYFDSKESLFLSIVEDWCSQIVDQASYIDHATARSRLVAIAAIDVEIAQKDPDLARVVVQQMPALVGNDRAAALRAIEPGVALLSEAFTVGLDSGEFGSEHHPATLAQLFLGALSTFELEALQPDARITLDDAVALIDTHFLEGLTARS